MAETRDPDHVARRLGEIAAEAGRLLAGIADRRAGHARKPDGTDASAADLVAEAMILARLKADFPEIPVVAEESLGAAGELFFLVDPLDGTSDYLSGAGEYSVNVALVRDGRPVAAALAVPVLGRVWIAGRSGTLAAPLGEAGAPEAYAAVRTRPVPQAGPVALESRRHGDSETERCLDALRVAGRLTASSAAKFGLIASGEADIYVRCGPTMEWDTAAGDHIVAQAGGGVVGPDGQPLRYGREGFRNGPFAAFGDPALARRIELPANCLEPPARR